MDTNKLELLRVILTKSFNKFVKKVEGMIS